MHIQHTHLARALCLAGFLLLIWWRHLLRSQRHRRQGDLSWHLCDTAWRPFGELDLQPMHACVHVYIHECVCVRVNVSTSARAHIVPTSQSCFVQACANNQSFMINAYKGKHVYIRACKHPSIHPLVYTYLGGLHSEFVRQIALILNQHWNYISTLFFDFSLPPAYTWQCSDRHWNENDADGEKCVGVDMCTRDNTANFFTILPYL